MNRTTQHKLIREHAPGWLDALRDETASIGNAWPQAHVFALMPMT